MQFDKTKHYVVRRKPDNRGTWSYQVYRTRLGEYMEIEGAFLTVVCDSETANQTVINIPISFLQEHVIPHAHCDNRGRFLFEVHKEDFVFNWHHGVKMDGKRWTVASFTSQSSHSRGRN